MEADERVVRVLVLDGNRAPWPNVMDGLKVQATFEGMKALYHRDLGYIVSAHSLRLAGWATPDKYDAVVIGNNEGYGVRRAKELPENMRSRTIIVWNRHIPERDAAEEAPYREMGFTNFGQRYSSPECPLGVREFIQQVAAEMYGR